MVNGFFLGGAAQGMQTAIDSQQNQQKLDLASQQQQDAEQQDLQTRGTTAIGNTLKIVNDTIDSFAKGDGSYSIGDYGRAIASVETGGAANPYQSLGAATKTGDRAYGKYQVMGENVGPWTKEVLGQELTPAQFLANPQAQEKVFQAKFGQYVAQTGSASDAASMWFTGLPAAAGGTKAVDPTSNMTGAEYVAKFADALSAIPGQKVAAAVAPLVKDAAAIAVKLGQDPGPIIDQVNAKIASTPTGVQAAISEGKLAAAKKIGEAQGLIAQGVKQADAFATAGIQSAGGGGLTADQSATLEKGIRDQYSNVVSEFQTQEEAFQQSGTAGGGSVGDTNLLINYMKMLNPRATVRPGSTATIDNAPGIPDAVLSLYNRLVKGGTLSNGDRDEINKGMGTLYKQAVANHQSLRDQFTAIAKSHGLDPANVVVDLPIGPTAPTGTAAATADTGTAGKIGAVPAAGFADAGTPPPAFIAAGGTADLWKMVPPAERTTVWGATK